MKRLHTLTDAGWDAYRRDLTGEKLGWVLYKSDRTFVIAHRVLMHPEDGPVVMIMNEVLEVAEDAAVFATEDAARDAYYAARREAPDA